jgi:hypothetical protein
MNDEKIFKLWFLLVGLMAVVWIGILVWAIINIVNWVVDK